MSNCDNSFINEVLLEFCLAEIISIPFLITGEMFSFL